MSWTLEEVRAGQMEVTLEDGSISVYTWEDASHEPGWCKLDWVIADKTRGQLANASNVLDPHLGGARTARSSRSTASSTRTTRRSTSSPTRSRSSRSS